MLPPAAKPTSTRTGLCGQFCAKAGGAASDAANAAPDVSSERREMIEWSWYASHYFLNSAVIRTGQHYLGHNMGGGVARGRGQKGRSAGVYAGDMTTLAAHYPRQRECSHQNE